MRRVNVLAQSQFRIFLSTVGYVSVCHLRRCTVEKENQTTLLDCCITQAQVCLVCPKLPDESLCNFPSLQALMSKNLSYWIFRFCQWLLSVYLKEILKDEKLKYWRKRYEVLDFLCKFLNISFFAKALTQTKLFMSRSQTIEETVTNIVCKVFWQHTKTK